jgi:hypothetical protein
MLEQIPKRDWSSVVSIKINPSLDSRVPSIQIFAKEEKSRESSSSKILREITDLQ